LRHEPATDIELTP